MASSNNEIRQAGDVTIQKVEIVNTSGFGQDITGQCIAIEVYEDLFSPFTTGVLIVSDTLDLMNLFPLTGEEFVNIKINTPTFDQQKNTKTGIIEDTFYIYKSSNREKLGDKKITYRLHFISVEAIIDLNTRITKAFSGRGSDIVSEIVSSTRGLNSKKKLVLEESSNSFKFVSNYWNPTQAINYAVSKSMNINSVSSFLFYQNRDGLNFRTLESIYGEPQIQDFVADNYVRAINMGQAVKDINEDYKRVEEISIPEIFDYIDDIKLGKYSSQMITHDLVTKKYINKNYFSENDFEKEGHLNQNSPISKDYIHRAGSKIFVKPSSKNNFTGVFDSSGTGTIQRRNSLLQQAENQKINITVPGRIDYTVGRTVNLKLYKMSPVSKGETDTIDNLFSGKYVTSAINHYIGRDTHTCYMELIKDSLVMDKNR